LGVLLTLAAGFLGWKMVQRHHVGIDLTAEQERLEPRGVAGGERLEFGQNRAHGQRVS
jgi:hypothetical protein